MNPPLPPFGNLKERDFAAILNEIYSQRIGGELVVTTPDFIKSVRVADGRIQFAASNLMADSFGQYLLRSGFITPEILEKSREIKARKNIRLGRILREMEVIGSAQLWETVIAHLKEIVFSLLTETEGNYEILHSPTPEGDPENILIGEPVPQILLEGIRRIDEEGFIARQLENCVEFFTAKSENRLPPQLAPWEIHILNLVAIHSRRDAIIGCSELMPFETQKTLYALLRLGYITDKLEREVEGKIFTPKERIPSFHSFDDALAYFNHRFEFIYRLLSKEIGPVAQSILSESITAILDRIPEYFQNVRFGETGSIEEKTILKTVWYLDFEENIADFLKGLEEMLYAEIFAAKRHLGRECEQQILQWLREAGD